jgi:hypothetical protein
LASDNRETEKEEGKEKEVLQFWSCAISCSDQLEVAHHSAVHLDTSTDDMMIAGQLKDTINSQIKLLIFVLSIIFLSNHIDPVETIILEALAC